jgi:oligoendopeptidase F
MTQQTTWNLGLLYKNDKDPQIEKDMLAIENACIRFEKKYKNKDFTTSPEKLKNALEDREQLSREMNGRKPWWYFTLKTDQNSDDEKSSALATKLDQRLTAATNRTTFFSLNIAKIPKRSKKEYLKHKALLPYRYSLSRTFDTAKYNLSEGEEQLADLLSQTSYDMWVDGRDKLLNQQVVEYKGEKIPLVKAVMSLSDKPKKDRRELTKLINEKFKDVSHFAEAELNAIYNYKKVMDERRGFAAPYSGSVLHNEQADTTVLNLTALITKNFKISHRFYKLHAKLLKEEVIRHEDRQTKIGEVQKKFTFEEACEIVRATFAKIDQKYADMFDKFLKEGRFDVYPKKGKKGGAYSWGMGELPTFVLLNHTDDIGSVETLAHEMGHAIHTELSRTQPQRYRGYSTAAAEVASTFFEQAVTEELSNYLSEKERVILLHNKILGDISTVFRQVACFNFELELHQRIRKEGQISKGDIADLMAKHLRSYLGSAVDVSHDDGYFYVYWSHIRRFFYVYTYAYGQLVSRAMFESWKKDHNFEKNVERFLSSGRSMSPDDIFKSIGIKTTEPSFFEVGLKGIEEDIKKLEKLSKKA